MNTSDIIVKVNAINQELNEVLEIFYKTKDYSEAITITTRNGRTYKVANVVELEDGSWKITDLVSRGMFLCDKCEKGSQIHIGDAWVQIFHNEKVVRIPSGLIHYLQNHPIHVNRESIDRMDAVLVS